MNKCNVASVGRPIVRDMLLGENKRCRIQMCSYNYTICELVLYMGHTTHTI